MDAGEQHFEFAPPVQLHVPIVCLQHLLHLFPLSHVTPSLQLNPLAEGSTPDLPRKRPSPASGVSNFSAFLYVKTISWPVCRGTSWRLNQHCVCTARCISGCRLFRKPSRHGFSFVVGCRYRGEASFRQVEPPSGSRFFFRFLVSSSPEPKTSLR